MHAFLAVENLAVSRQFNWDLLFLVDDLELHCSDQVLNVLCRLQDCLVFEFRNLQVETRLCFLCRKLQLVLELELLPQLLARHALLLLLELQQKRFGAVNHQQLLLIKCRMMTLGLDKHLHIITHEPFNSLDQVIMIFADDLIEQLIKSVALVRVVILEHLAYRQVLIRPHLQLLYCRVLL